MITFNIRSIQDKEISLTSYNIEYPNTLWNNQHWQPQKRPAILILLGNGYSELSESEPVALSFLSAGYQAFVLHYSAREESIFPKPLEHVSSALWYIRSNADVFHIEQDKIAVCGVSAGGHLASLLGTQWNLNGLAEKLQLPYEGNKPNAVILGYSLTNMLPNQLNYNIPAGAMIQNNSYHFSSDNISKETPPTFIWHTKEHEIVSAKQSIQFAQALHKHRIPYELHVFSKGPHADLSTTAPYIPSNNYKWIPLSIDWLNNLFDLTQ